MAKQQVMTRRNEGQTLEVLGTRVRFLCDADRTDAAWSLLEVSIPRDAGAPPHSHDWDEAYFVTSGAVEFMLGSDTVMVGAGDFLYAPGGTMHSFRGASEEDARMLVFDAPAHAADFFKDIDREVRGPADMARVPAIGDRHGVRFAPPATSNQEEKGAPTPLHLAAHRGVQ